MFAQIIIDITSDALDRAYTYHVPEGMDVHIGNLVTIPFGNSRMPQKGYVVGLSETCDLDITKIQIKEILSVVDNAISVQEQLIRLAAWMSAEYGTTLNQCLKTVLPVRKTVRKNARRIDPLLRYQNEKDEEHTLNEEQAKAALQVIAGFSKCCRELPHDKVPAYLLYGITGSGKTEVYLHVMETVIDAGYQVILLIPEISLTYQTVIRVSTRFRGKVAILNSKMSLGERYEQYRRCERGEVSIMIGPRSAVFAPFEKLGLIIMDEEHEGAYKSETAPRYETRDVAMQRARMASCPVLYGSATPSLDVYKKALAKEITLLELHQRAKTGSQLAETEIIDLREELREGNRSIFSRRLHELIGEKLAQNEQIMLFMNRRGYSSFVSCRSCGKSIRCPHCDVSLTLHRDRMLRCHYCGYEIPLMKNCPTCGSPYLAPFGFGTEKLETLVKETFPAAKVLRMDADTTKNKGGHEQILEQFRAHKADILIGTQMIVKGHDFPDVTLVGLIAADLSLSAPDFRAAERTFQLITQAAGRAGRGGRRGNVIIQTYQPDHYAIALSKEQDYQSFFRKEFTYRKLLGYPPVEHLMTIQIQSKDEDMLEMTVQNTVTAFKSSCTAAKAELIGPLNATVYKVNDIYRKIVYIKHESHDIIIQLRDQFTETLRRLDRRGLCLLNYDLQ